MYSSGNEIVDKVGAIHFEGNIIPFNWYSVFTFENGKPDLNAIIILSEIVYWYRPKIVRDENSGMTLGIAKRFKADLLQRSYESFADQFGLSKRQVKEAFDRLCETGVIERDFRRLDTGKTVLFNVMFIKIDPEILCSVSLYQGGTFKRMTLPRSNVGGGTFKRNTYTENTTENTTDIDTNSVNEVLKLWTPDMNILNSRLNIAGEKTMTWEQVLPVLIDVNSHYENMILNGSATPNKMYSNFVKWVKGDYAKYRKPSRSTSAPVNNKNVNQAWGQEQYYAPVSETENEGDLL